MTGYDGRLRTLEGRFGGGQCPLCDGAPVIDFVTIHAGETLPLRQVCETCGTPHTVFIVEIDTDPTVPDVTDTMPRTQRHAKPRTRRRQWYG